MEELLAVVACFGCSHMVVILERSILFHLNDIISFITNNNYEHIDTFCRKENFSTCEGVC